MKTCILIVALTFTLSYCLVFGKIKNGYEQQLRDGYASLRSLQLELLTDGLSVDQKRKIKSCIVNIQNYILYHRLTEELIHQLKTICPDIYQEIDTISDKQHRTTDVYIKLIPKEESSTEFSGATFFHQTSHDKSRHVSEYGEGTVSIKIWIAQDALKILCHELGHVKYVIPNLARYVEFYNVHYRLADMRADEIGHRPGDLSGRSAYEFEQRFRHHYAAYIKNGNPPLASALNLMHRLRKDDHHQSILSSEDIDLLTKKYP